MKKLMTREIPVNSFWSSSNAVVTVIARCTLQQQGNSGVVLFAAARLQKLMAGCLSSTCTPTYTPSAYHATILVSQYSLISLSLPYQEVQPPWLITGSKDNMQGS